METARGARTANSTRWERLARRGALAFAAMLLAGCSRFPVVLQDHPLAGRVWDASERRFIPVAEAASRITAAQIALLGETHDNPVHHEIQLRVLERRIAAGQRPALVVEQIDTEWQSAVDAARSDHATAADIAAAGRISPTWKWPLYEPIFALARDRGIAIVAANLSRARARGMSSFAALGAGEAERLALESTWNGERNAALRHIVVEAHCGQDHAGTDRMVDVQRARDATMADRILANPSDVVAIIGRGHARKDLGVPLYLAKRAPHRSVLSVGMVEVERDGRVPSDYPEAATGVHDLVWFTPRAERPEPCPARGRGEASAPSAR